MPLRETYKGLDRIALHVVGAKNICDSFGEIKPEVAQMIRQTTTQYWLSQANISIIFTTIFSSVFIGLFFNLKHHYKLVVIPVVVVFIYFSLKAWANGRCAKIVCRLWL